MGLSKLFNIYLCALLISFTKLNCFLFAAKLTKATPKYKRKSDENPKHIQQTQTFQPQNNEYIFSWIFRFFISILSFYIFRFFFSFSTFSRIATLYMFKCIFDMLFIVYFICLLFALFAWYAGVGVLCARKRFFICKEKHPKRYLMKFFKFFNDIIFNLNILSCSVNFIFWNFLLLKWNDNEESNRNCLFLHKANFTSNRKFKPFAVHI